MLPPHRSSLPAAVAPATVWAPTARSPSSGAYIAVNDLVVRAATDHEPRHIRHAAMAGPATAATLPVERIWDLCDDLVRAHGEPLPPEPRAELGH